MTWAGICLNIYNSYMLIGLFKKGFISQLVIYFIVATLLWIDGFIFPHHVEIEGFNSPFFIWFGTGLNRLPTIIPVIFAFIILILESFLLNWTLVTHRVIPRNNFLPALIYTSLMSFSPELLTIHPVLLANLFIIFAIKILMGLYNKSEPYQEIFSAGLMVSLASIIYLPSAIFIAIIWTSLFIFRTITVREIIISITGFMIPLVFEGMLFFWNDQFSDFFDRAILYYTRIERFTPPSYYLDWTFAAFITILALIAFFRISYLTSETVISVRKRLIISMYFIVIATFTYIYMGSNYVYHSAILLVPLSILISYYFVSLKKKFWAELFYTLLLVIIISGKFIALQGS